MIESSGFISKPMNYPSLLPLTFASLKLIKQHIQADPEYLSHPDCPYDDDIKSFFDGFTPKGGVPKEGTDARDVSTELNVLYDELIEFKDHLGVEDVAERMSYFRTRTALIEKILTLKERAAGLSEISVFQEIVLGILDDLMTPDQRTDFAHRLKDYL